jgi:hypothetical protein
MASLTSALTHVPLVNGACVGSDADSPDVAALEGQLVAGRALLGELQGAVATLLGPTGGGQAGGGGGAAALQHQRGVPTTAALASALLQVGHVRPPPGVPEACCSVSRDPPCSWGSGQPAMSCWAPWLPPQPGPVVPARCACRC